MWQSKCEDGEGGEGTYPVLVDLAHWPHKLGDISPVEQRPSGYPCPSLSPDPAADLSPSRLCARAHSTLMLEAELAGEVT